MSSTYQPTVLRVELRPTRGGSQARAKQVIREVESLNECLPIGLLGLGRITATLS